MISRLLIPTLLALPLCAQAPTPVSSPVVRIIIQADPPPAGTPTLDTAPIAKALGDFANQQGFVAPATDGDGWVLGVQLKTQAEPGGQLLAAGATLRLARVETGRLVKKDLKQSGLVAEATTSRALSSALAWALVRRAQSMLSDAKVVANHTPTGDHESTSRAPNTVVAVEPKDHDFSQVRIAYQPPQPGYPQVAKATRVQGVVRLEMNIDPDGKPESVVALEGPGPLLDYAMEWSLRWRFKPLMVDGIPTPGRFVLNINFTLPPRTIVRDEFSPMK